MPKTLTKASLQRQLREARMALESQSGQINSMMMKMAEASAKTESLMPKVFAREIEIARLQGYIDRVLDEGRPGPQTGPTSHLDKLREAVIHDDLPIDGMSDDQIERLTGRDDHA